MYIETKKKTSLEHKQTEQDGWGRVLMEGSHTELVWIETLPEVEANYYVTLIRSCSFFLISYYIYFRYSIALIISIIPNKVAALCM